MVEYGELCGWMWPRSEHSRSCIAVQRLRVVVHNGPHRHQVGHTRAGQAGQREHVRIRSLLLQRFMCCRNTATTGLRLDITGLADSNNIRDLGHVLRAAFLRAGVPTDLQRGRLRALQRQILRPARRRDEGDAQRLAAYLSDLVV